MKAKENRIQLVVGYSQESAKRCQREATELLSKLAKNSEAQATSFKSCVRDFSPYSGSFALEQECQISGIDLPPSGAVFVGLVYLAGFWFGGRFEKVAWSIPFRFKSFPFAFSLQKFGLKLYFSADAPPPDGTVAEMLRHLNKALGFTEQLFEPIAVEKVKEGQVTIENHYHQLDGMYQFFRGKARKVFARKHVPPHRRPGWIFSVKDINRYSSVTNKAEHVGFYYSEAMVDAYFSRLEHLLIILLPFSGYDPTKHDLVRLINAGWSEKFKTTIDMATNPQAKSLYDQARTLKEHVRNTTAHGNFEKDGKSLYFHMEGVGALPLQFSEAQDRAGFPKVTHEKYLEICTLFDKLDGLLEEVAPYGIRYAKAGLDVAFDVRSRQAYATASTSVKAFTKFLDYQSCLCAMHANMDW